MGTNRQRVFELFAAILLLMPPTVAIGAVMSVGVIGGAIFSHLTQLGIRHELPGIAIIRREFRIQQR